MKPIDTEGLSNLTEQVQKVGHIIFGLVAVVAVISVIITSIVAGIQNSHEDDPQKESKTIKDFVSWNCINSSYSGLRNIWTSY
ncbi:Uncharacterised protein (plasmid) [Mesomycoplasma conjunctivae]|nr:Uncharacterised protein [Mesomycoplasma conjunctivae]